MCQRIICVRWGISPKGIYKQRLLFMCKKLLGGVILKAFMPCLYFQTFHWSEKNNRTRNTISISMVVPRWCSPILLIYLYVCWLCYWMKVKLQLCNCSFNKPSFFMCMVTLPPSLLLIFSSPIVVICKKCFISKSKL